MQQINLAEASKNLPELIEAAINGEEIVITKDNHPVVKLTPVSPVEKRWPAKAGSAKGLITVSDDVVKLTPVSPVERRPLFGSAKGLITISDDFDEPLEDFKDYM